MNPYAFPFNNERIRSNKYGVALPYPDMPESVIRSINMHPSGYTVLVHYPELIRWDIIECNQSNFAIYSRYPQYITERAVITNPNLINLWHLKNNPNLITWKMLQKKPSLKKLLPQDVTKVTWSSDNY